MYILCIYGSALFVYVSKYNGNDKTYVDYDSENDIAYVDHDSTIDITFEIKVV